MTSTAPTALIFGAAGGIGSELARALAGSGFALALAGRSQESLAPISQEVGGLPVVADVTVSDEVEQAFDKTIAYYGRLDAVALCVGSILLKPAHLTTDEDWQQVLAVNLTSAFSVVRAAAKQMKQGEASSCFPRQPRGSACPTMKRLLQQRLG